MISATMQGGENVSIDQEKMIVEALSSLYPLKDYEEDAINTVLEALPHWIPVEQDTPKEDDDYWCTFGAETGWFVDWCSWYQGRWVVWIDGNPADVSNVIAWCKPIEPYKAI